MRACFLTFLPKTKDTPGFLEGRAKREKWLPAGEIGKCVPGKAWELGRVIAFKVLYILWDISHNHRTKHTHPDKIYVIIIYNLTFSLCRLVRMNHGDLLCHTPGNGKAVQHIGHDI